MWSLSGQPEFLPGSQAGMRDFMVVECKVESMWGVAPVFLKAFKFVVIFCLDLAGMLGELS